MTIRNVIPISGIKNNENLAKDFRMLSSKYVYTE